MKYPIQVLFREYFEGILAAVFLALFLRFFVINILYIPTDNMEPSLKRGDFVIGWRLSYGFPLPLMRGERLNMKPPVPGDVISFRFPGDENQIIVRRVIGVGGDQLKIEKGEISINGQVLQTKDLSKGLFLEKPDQLGKGYRILQNSKIEMTSLEVPKGSLFVMADNRFRGDDSRDWGFVPINHVESKIVWIWLSVENSGNQTSVRWDRMFQWVN